MGRIVSHLGRRAAAAAMLCLAAMGGSARAHSGASVRLVLDGVISPRCDFVNLPANMALNLPATQATSGAMGFSCNLPDAAPVNISISSQNGGLKRQGGGEIVPYALSWSAAGGTEIAIGHEPVSFTVNSGQAGEVRQGQLVMRALTGTAPVVAGQYTDSITYTISP